MFAYRNLLIEYIFFFTNNFFTKYADALVVEAHRIWSCPLLNSVLFTAQQDVIAARSRDDRAFRFNTRISIWRATETAAAAAAMAQLRQRSHRQRRAIGVGVALAFRTRNPSSDGLCRSVTRGRRLYNARRTDRKTTASCGRRVCSVFRAAERWVEKFETALNRGRPRVG